MILKEFNQVQLHPCLFPVGNSISLHSLCPMHEPTLLGLLMMSFRSVHLRSTASNSIRLRALTNPPQPGFSTSPKNDSAISVIFCTHCRSSALSQPQNFNLIGRPFLTSSWQDSGACRRHSLMAIILKTAVEDGRLSPPHRQQPESGPGTDN